jgi:hypothetical protein
MDWEINVTFKKNFGKFQKEKKPERKKRKYFNYKKKGHFVRECRSIKINSAKAEKPKEKKEEKKKKKKKNNPSKNKKGP